MAYSYYSSVLYGNSTGPSGGYNVFRTCVQYYFEDNGTSWILKRRVWVEVTKSDGSAFSSNFTCNWLSSAISIGGKGVGTYGDSGWVTLNKKFPYSGAVVETLEGYYTSYSSGTIKSTVSPSFNALGDPTHTVTYNANGGSGAPAAQTKTYGTILTLSSTKPTRKGYTFQGWGTSSTDTTTDYFPGGQYGSDVDITLYAIWEKKTNCFIKENDAYKMGMMYVKDNGIYKTGEITVKRK